MNADDAFDTPEVRALDAELDAEQADAAELLAAVGRAEQEWARDEADDADDDPRLVAAELARRATDPRASAVLHQLAQRVLAGDLTWLAVASGEHLDDPDVQAVVAANLDAALAVDDPAPAPAAPTEPEPEPEPGDSVLGHGW